uniref:hypothetical protein n=1 Tax=Roseivirga sp. TaxID=1964215 RepID=UPI00404736BB
MKGERKYYIIIFSIFLILFLIQQSQKEPTNYEHTYSHRDKNPYGGYVLKTLLPEFLGDNEVQSLNLTVYELEDQFEFDHNLILIADHAEGKPVAITVEWSAGKMVLSTTPLAFTNNYFFFEENSRFASALMSELPSQATIWTEYYQLGRLQFGSPLSIIMKTSALRLAYTITLVSLALFMVFEAKRRQRIIPIIVPLKNTTVDFIKTIGNLYMRKGNHKDIALKRIQYLLEHIRTKYYLNFEKFNADFFEKLAAKSGQDVISIKKLFDQIERIKNKAQVSAQELQLLSQQIEVFYGRK